MKEQTLLPRVCDFGGEGGQVCAPGWFILTLPQLGRRLQKQYEH